MSCIDAAIIKALVDHIGMDPSDVPVGSPHECIKYTAGEGININENNVISSTNACKCAAVADEQLDLTFSTTINEEQPRITIKTKDDKNITHYIQLGDMLVIETTNNSTRLYCYCIESNVLSNKLSFVGISGIRNFTVSANTLITDYPTNAFRPIGIYRINSLELVSNALKLLTGIVATSNA